MTPTRRRLPKRLLAAAALSLLSAGTAALILGGSRERARLAAAAARADAADPGWRFADTMARHNAAVAPPGSNAADAALAALALDSGALQAWQVRKEKSPPALVSNRRMAPDAAAAAEAAHAGCLPAILVARRLREFPGGALSFAVVGPDPYTNFLNAAQQLRGAAELLALDARVCAHRGDPAGALSACLTGFHLADVGVGAEPTAFGQHMGGAIASIALAEVEQAFAWGEAAGAQLAEVQQAARRERLAPRLRLGWRGERGMQMALYDALEAGAAVPVVYRVGADARPPAGPLDTLRSWSWRGELTAARWFALEDAEAVIAAADSPDPERAGAVHTRMAVAPPNQLATIYRMAFDKYEGYAAGNRARLACAEVAVACERFRLATGRWPGSLAELTADILSAAPSDPYTGRPLLYRATTDGVTVASAGPVGGPEVAFRLYDPAARAAPAD